MLCAHLVSSRYDEEDADISLQIGADGSIEAERAARQQEDVKRKLQQGTCREEGCKFRR